MFNKITMAGRSLGRKAADRSTAWALAARDMASGFITTARYSLMGLGLCAIGTLALMYVKPEVADHLKAMSPFAAEIASQEDTLPEQASAMDMPGKSFAQSAPVAAHGAATALADFHSKKVSLTQEQMSVAKWLSRRYRVASDATQVLVGAAYRTADELQLDPLLILAVAAIESGFNPFAESAMGAQGLMQVMSKIHHDKFRELGGVKAALNPVANMKVGARILKEYVRRGGSVEAGLKMYVGAAAMETDQGYGAKVLAEYRRLQDVAAGKTVPVYSTAAKAPAKPAESDAVSGQKLENTVASEDKAAVVLPPAQNADRKEHAYLL